MKMSRLMAIGLIGCMMISHLSVYTAENSMSSMRTAASQQFQKSKRYLQEHKQKVVAGIISVVVLALIAAGIFKGGQEFLHRRLKKIAEKAVDTLKSNGINLDSIDKKTGTRFIIYGTVIQQASNAQEFIANVLATIGGPDPIRRIQAANVLKSDLENAQLYQALIALGGEEIVKHIYGQLKIVKPSE
jgi:hypothetical protein